MVNSLVTKLLNKETLARQVPKPGSIHAVWLNTKAVALTPLRMRMKLAGKGTVVRTRGQGKQTNPTKIPRLQ